MKTLLNYTCALSVTLLVSACSSSTIVFPVQPKRLVLETTSESNGQVYTTRYEYDANNNIAREIYGDGDDAAIRAYQVSETGRVSSRTWDGNGDGTPEYRADYLYADNGDLVTVYEFDMRSQMYTDAFVLNYENGAVTSIDEYDIIDVASADLIDLSTVTATPIQTFEYENGILTAENELYVLDGSISLISSYSYNLDGTLSMITDNDVVEGVSGTSVMQYEEADCNSNNFISLNRYYCIK